MNCLWGPKKIKVTGGDLHWCEQESGGAGAAGRTPPGPGGETFRSSWQEKTFRSSCQEMFRSSWLAPHVSAPSDKLTHCWAESEAGTSLQWSPVHITSTLQRRNFCLKSSLKKILWDHRHCCWQRICSSDEKSQQTKNQTKKCKNKQRRRKTSRKAKTTTWWRREKSLSDQRHRWGQRIWSIGASRKSHNQ